MIQETETEVSPSQKIVDKINEEKNPENPETQEMRVELNRLKNAFSELIEHLEEQRTISEEYLQYLQEKVLKLKK